MILISEIVYILLEKGKKNWFWKNETKLIDFSIYYFSCETKNFDKLYMLDVLFYQFCSFVNFAKI